MLPFETIVQGLEVGEQVSGVRVQCSVCPHCDQAAVVDISEDEYAWLASGRSVPDALSGRSLAFRELFISGIHEHCWEAIFACDEDEDD